MSSHPRTINRSLFALASAIALACVLAAPGARAEEVRSETVKCQDLNVNTSAGVEALYSRIHSAAKRVCANTDPVMQSAVIACTRTSEAEAIEKVNLPSLTAYYRMKN